MKTQFDRAARLKIQEIGSRIVQRREQLGLTRMALEAKLADGRGRCRQVTRWETGLVAPGALALIDLSRALNCTVDWLLKGDEGLPGPVGDVP